MNVSKTAPNSLLSINTHKQKEKESIEELSSGNKIKISDAAMMQIAEALLSDASVMSQSLQNANESIAMLQIADGVLQNISKGATKLQELNVRANSASLNSDQRAMLQKEFTAQKNAMNDAIQSATFQNKPLFGSDMQNINIPKLSPDALSLGDTNAIEEFVKSIESAAQEIGSGINEYVSSINNLLVSRTNTLAAYSQMADTDMAKSVTLLEKEGLLEQSTLYTQAHKNEMDTQRLQALLV